MIDLESKLRWRRGKGKRRGWCGVWFLLEMESMVNRSTNSSGTL